jgi:hypothetical protein
LFYALHLARLGDRSCPALIVSKLRSLEDPLSVSARLPPLATQTIAISIIIVDLSVMRCSHNASLSSTVRFNDALCEPSAMERAMMEMSLVGRSSVFCAPSDRMFVMWYLQRKHPQIIEAVSATS